jgi:hypothetical protein
VIVAKCDNVMIREKKIKKDKKKYLQELEYELVQVLEREQG